MPKEVRSKNSRFRSQSYRKEWEKENWAQGWLKVSSQGASKAFCQFCDKNILAGKSELMRHAKTAQHCQNAAQVLGSTSMEQYVTSSQGFIKAELNTVALIARRNISFNFMSYMVPTLKHIASDSKAIKDMTSGRTKTTYLLTECLAVDAHERAERCDVITGKFAFSAPKSNFVSEIAVPQKPTSLAHHTNGSSVKVHNQMTSQFE
ncbi:unnamed protein product [Clavelina lepadiformis]|uniref:BED-type domain-containing protein n=1 Tax=Clavelina lepadiformis TaxID=159417 RepID=A0ABP0G107_CLALP